VRLIKSQWPVLLRGLRKIPDPRNPQKIQHALISVMLYGLLVFVLQFSSRRQANTEITRPMFKENLLSLFPELNDLPHADTLFRLLRRIEVSQIEQAHIDLVQRLIRQKKFANYRINNCYPIAIDGTQKMRGSVLWCDELQERRVSGSEQDPPEQVRY